MEKDDMGPVKGRYGFSVTPPWIKKARHVWLMGGGEPRGWFRPRPSQWFGAPETQTDALAGGTHDRAPLEDLPPHEG